MRRKYKIWFAIGLCITMMAGCEKTPDEVIVKEKGAGNMEAYESGDETGELLRETLGVPEHYKKESVYEDGGLVIDTDAEVIVPEVSAIDTVNVTAREGNQELIDTVTKAFFDGDKIYNGISYSTMTKAYIEERLALLKRYKAENNLDPYEYGKDENGNLYFNIDQEIENYEGWYQNAPDDVAKEEVTPAFGLKYPDGEGGTQTYDYEFFGVAETKNGNYEYDIISEDPAISKEIHFKISRMMEQEDSLEFSAWQEGQYVRNPESEQYLSDEFLKNLAGISYEEAKKQAEEKAERLGMDLELYDWDYAVFYHGEGGVTEQNSTDAGYRFYFTRKILGTPIIYTIEQGGSYVGMESTEVPWGYEICNILVGDDGILEVELDNPYVIGEVQTKNVKMMDFDSMIKIYEQMMEVSNADITEYEKKRTFHIKKITLGYSRIYDPLKDNTGGVLVPVWDFFGGFDSEDKEGNVTNKDSGEYSMRSFMTINAIDGTVIDRSLGY
ncbi:MAG: hypothetical protein K2I10_12535 [Lachnospiraceae bacterium]|nr:hypothetical protein [Lachnospiraceae bacterium]